MCLLNGERVNTEWIDENVYIKIRKLRDKKKPHKTFGNEFVKFKKFSMKFLRIQIEH